MRPKTNQHIQSCLGRAVGKAHTLSRNRAIICHSLQCMAKNYKHIKYKHPVFIFSFTFCTASIHTVTNQRSFLLICITFSLRLIPSSLTHSSYTSSSYSLTMASKDDLTLCERRFFLSIHHSQHPYISLTPGLHPTGSQILASMHGTVFANYM